MSFEIGDRVRYLPGHDVIIWATVVGYRYPYILIELPSGKRIGARRENLEETS